MNYAVVRFRKLDALLNQRSLNIFSGRTNGFAESDVSPAREIAAAVIRKGIGFEFVVARS